MKERPGPFTRIPVIIMRGCEQDPPPARLLCGEGLWRALDRGDALPERRLFTPRAVNRRALDRGDALPARAGHAVELLRGGVCA